MQNLEFGLNFLKLADFENSEFLRSFKHKFEVRTRKSEMYSNATEIHIIHMTYTQKLIFAGRACHA